MDFKALSNFISRIFYGWRMVGLVPAIRIVGRGLHQFGFTIAIGIIKSKSSLMR